MFVNVFMIFFLLWLQNGDGFSFIVILILDLSIQYKYRNLIKFCLEDWNTCKTFFTFERT